MANITQSSLSWLCFNMGITMYLSFPTVYVYHYSSTLMLMSSMLTALSLFVGDMNRYSNVCQRCPVWFPEFLQSKYAVDVEVNYFLCRYISHAIRYHAMMRSYQNIHMAIKVVKFQIMRVPRLVCKPSFELKFYNIGQIHNYCDSIRICLIMIHW